MNKQPVIDFLRQLTLKPSKNINQFWRDLEYDHGRRVTDMLKQSMANRIPGSTTNEIYSIKNQSLRLSLSFANYSADLYRQFFDWFVAMPQQKAERWLDVGCDNGIVTCFIATLFPESEVVGVDIEESAISCAIALANQLGLTNVRFFQSDVWNLDAVLDENSFDRIISVRSFHEILGEMGNPPHCWATQDLFGRGVKAENLRVLRTIRGLLRDESSEMITFERLPRMSSTVVWVNQLQQAGLYVHWDKADIINFHEVGENQKMPVLVCGVKPAGANILQDVYHLYEAEVVKELAAGAEYMDDLAEAILYRLESKQFLSGIQIDFSETDKMRYEMWRTERLVIVYQYTNAGNRKLNVLSEDGLPGVINDFQVTIPSYYQNQGLEIETYQCPRAN